MSAASLETALRALGVGCSVEAHDRLAVIIPSDDHVTFEDPGLRRAATGLLAAHGFTHLALEVTGAPSPTAAAVRLEASALDGAAVHRD